MTLPDEFAKMFPPMSPELTALLTELDGVPAALAALTDRVAALEPPPPPVPDIDTIHVGAAIKQTNVAIGWAVIQKTALTAATAAIVDKCAAAKKMHLIGFGPSSPLQTAEGGPIDFTYHDKIYGAPGTDNGYFGANGLRVLTAYGCPPYMRVPKPGTAPMPIAPTTGLYDEVMPHWSHHDNFAKLVAAFVARYNIDVVEDLNEWKGEYVGTPVAGSAMVPPGSGLVLAPGPVRDRWLMEHHTDRLNWIWRRVKELGTGCKIAAGYMVTRTYQDAANPDSATGPFPMLLQGPWGHADKKAMQAMMYLIEHAVGFDYLCLDTKTSTNDGTPSITPENQWAGLQKILDWEQWFNDLADWDPVKYGRAKNAMTWYSEAYTRLPGGLTPTNHAEAVATDAWGIINYVYRSRAAAWMRWQTEGNRTAVDPASAHSIALVNAQGSPNSLQETEAVPMYAGLVEHFPPGTQLYNVTVDGYDSNPVVTGIASDTTMCLVSRWDQPITYTFKGAPLVLAPYDVRFIAR